jgi:hypothetical protein
MDWTMVSAIYRIWWFRFISLGVGGYGAFATGDVHRITEYENSFDEEYTSYGVHKKEGGLISSLAFRIPLSKKVSFILHGQATYGLFDSARGKPDKMNFRDTQVFIGLRFWDKK